MLNGMHDELNKGKPKQYIAKDFTNGETLLDQFAYYNERIVLQEDSKIQEMFFGNNVSTFECQKCGHCVYAFDSFLDIPAVVPHGHGNLNVYDCINALFNDKTHIDDYYCIGCKGRTTCVQSMAPFQLPEILIITLKRYGATDGAGNFSMFGRARGLKKNDASIDIPQVLDMRPFIHPEAKDVTLEGADSYKLFGISHHYGSLMGGHYTSEAQDIDSEEWFS